MKKAIGVVSAALLVLALRAPAQGVELRVGATANYGVTNNFGVGPRVELDFEDFIPGLHLAADYHRYFDSTVYSDIDGLNVESKAWDTGFHILYDFTTVAVAEGATLYAGAGVLYAERTYDHWLRTAPGDITDGELRNRYSKLVKLKDTHKSASGISGALTLGSTFHTGWTVLPFVEARYTLGVVDEFMASVGILFSTGSRAKQ